MSVAAPGTDAGDRGLLSEDGDSARHCRVDPPSARPPQSATAYPQLSLGHVGCREVSHSVGPSTDCLTKRAHAVAELAESSVHTHWQAHIGACSCSVPSLAELSASMHSPSPSPFSCLLKITPFIFLALRFLLLLRDEKYSDIEFFFFGTCSHYLKKSLFYAPPDIYFCTQIRHLCYLFLL